MGTVDALVTGKLVEVSWKKGKEVSSCSKVLQDILIGKTEHLKEALPSLKVKIC